MGKTREDQRVSINEVTFTSNIILLNRHLSDVGVKSSTQLTAQKTQLPAIQFHFGIDELLLIYHLRF